MSKLDFVSLCYFIIPCFKFLNRYLDKKLSTVGTTKISRLSASKKPKTVGTLTEHFRLNKHLYTAGATDSSFTRGCLTEEE